MLCRARQSEPETARVSPAQIGLIQASLDGLPIRAGWADVTLCALALGHLPDLTSALSELRRVTRPDGLLLCSDFHPIGQALGWRRDFKAAGQRYAVWHTAHTPADWRAASAKAGLRIIQVLEPRLDRNDIPPGAKIASACLEAPVVMAVALCPIGQPGKRRGVRMRAVV